MLSNGGLLAVLLTLVCLAFLCCPVLLYTSFLCCRAIDVSCCFLLLTSLLLFIVIFCLVCMFAICNLCALVADFFSFLLCLSSLSPCRSEDSIFLKKLSNFDFPGGVLTSLQALGLDNMGVRHWSIYGCSAASGAHLLESIDWLIADISARIYIMD